MSRIEKFRDLGEDVEGEGEALGAS